MNFYFSIMAVLKKILIVIMAFILPIKFLLVVTGLAIFLDTITGIYKAIKIKDSITSRKLSNILSKFLLYESAILFAYILDKYLLGEFTIFIVNIPLLITKIVTVTLVFIEVFSINENIRIITGISFFQKFKDFVTRAKNIKEDIVELKKNED
jgi:hypothetical protein